MSKTTQHIEKLKPCPFCGKPALLVEDDSYGSCGIGCNCAAEPWIQRDIGDIEDAAKVWNTRSDK